MEVSTFGTVLAEALAAKGLRPNDLAKALDIPKSLVSYYLAGKSAPRPDRLRSICSFLKITLTDCVGNQHGESHTRLYNIWRGMKQRCYCPAHDSYQHYGLQGVTVCEDWLHSFSAFREWALAHGYQAHLSLDRIDPYGSYHPSNCRWATYKEQAQNKRGKGGHHEHHEQTKPRTRL